MNSLISVSQAVFKSNTGLDAITRAPIVNYVTPHKCLRIQNVSREEPFDKWGYTEVSQDNFKKFKLKKDSIVISRTGGSVGTLRYIDQDYNAVYNNGLINLVISSDFNSKFIYYCFKLDAFNRHIQKCSLGNSTQENIRINDMLEYKIPFFERNVQNKIAETLSSIDNKIENNQKISNQLEIIAETIYNYWFLQFEFPNEKDKPYKSSGGKMIWNEELKKEIPKNWDIITLSDISLCHDSKRVPLSDSDRKNKNGEIPYYGATGIMDFIDDFIFDGDYVLLAEDGSIMNENGNPILQRINGKTWVNNHAHVLEPKKGYSCKLLMMLLKDISVMKIKTGSIQMKINQENMNKIAFPKIPDELLKKINYELEMIDSHQIQLKLENEKLLKLRSFLLPLLMSGQVGFKS